jgi:small-conductance mechanosensitive channel
MWLWERLFGRSVDWHIALSAVVTAFITAAVCAEILAALVRRFLAPKTATEERRRYAKRAVRLVRGAFLLLLTLLFIPPFLDLFGQPLTRGLRLDTLVEWGLEHGFKILFISTLAYVMVRIIDVATTRFERHLTETEESPSDEYAKRARTLGDLTRNVATAAVVVAAVIWILQELDFNALPILTGASIAGVALGFGAQTLVKDIISGFFMILENQVRVGDVAEINGKSGLVEAIHLRTILLRDQRGAVHVFPCGSITSLANLTKDFAYAVLDVRVHYRHDTDAVIDVLRKTATTIQQDPVYAASIFDALEVLGVENLGDKDVTIRVRLKTVALRQWDVERELRRRIKKAFEDAGIEIPIVVALGSGIQAPASAAPPPSDDTAIGG